MAKAKLLQIPVSDENLLDWISKSQKEMKIKTTAEFIRTVINYVRFSGGIGELKHKIEKTHLEALLQEADAKAQAAMKAKEQIQERLEKINA